MAEAAHDDDPDENLSEMNIEETVQIRPLTWAFMPHAKPFPMCEHNDSANLLILPKRIYIFIRLYTLVFERLCHAGELCGRDRGLHSRPINSHSSILDAKRKNADHKQFYDHLYTLINGEMQEDEFERYLHKLLGPHCYNLVTMKALLKSMERQLLVLFSANEKEDMAKTVKLFLAHHQRQKAFTNHGRFARLYYDNVVKNLGNQDLVLLQFFTSKKELAMWKIPADLKDL